MDTQPHTLSQLQDRFNQLVERPRIANLDAGIRYLFITADNLDHQLSRADANQLGHLLTQLGIVIEGQNIIQMYENQYHRLKTTPDAYQPNLTKLRRLINTVNEIIKHRPHATFYRAHRFHSQINPTDQTIDIYQPIDAAFIPTVKAGLKKIIYQQPQMLLDLKAYQTKQQTNLVATSNIEKSQSELILKFIITDFNALTNYLQTYVQHGRAHNHPQIKTQTLNDTLIELVMYQGLTNQELNHYGLKLIEQQIVYH